MYLFKLTGPNFMKFVASDIWKHLTSDAKIDSKINTRIAQASAAFGELSHRLIGVSIPTKFKVYKAVVIPTLFYDSEV